MLPLFQRCTAHRQEAIDALKSAYTTSVRLHLLLVRLWLGLRMLLLSHETNVSVSNAFSSRGGALAVIYVYEQCILLTRGIISHTVMPDGTGS